MPKGIVWVRQDLTGKKPPGIAFELTERELAAIGEVTVQWAYLEHQVLEMTLVLAKTLGEPSPDKAAHFSFDRRLNYLKTLLKSQSGMSRHAAAAFSGDADLSPLIDPNGLKRRRRGRG